MRDTEPPEIDPQFQGLSLHRLQDNPEEGVFAAAWQEHNQTGSRTTLAYLLDPSNQKYPEDPSERDWKVANTVIQWLGSPVGRAFLKQCGYRRVDSKGVTNDEWGRGED